MFGIYVVGGLIDEFIWFIKVFGVVNCYYRLDLFFCFLVVFGSYEWIVIFIFWFVEFLVRCGCLVFGLGYVYEW